MRANVSTATFPEALCDSGCAQTRAHLPAAPKLAVSKFLPLFFPFLPYVPALAFCKNFVCVTVGVGGGQGEGFVGERNGGCSQEAQPAGGQPKRHGRSAGGGFQLVSFCAGVAFCARLFKRSSNTGAHSLSLAPCDVRPGWVGWCGSCGVSLMREGLFFLPPPLFLVGQCLGLPFAWMCWQVCRLFVSRICVAVLVLGCKVWHDFVEEHLVRVV